MSSSPGKNKRPAIVGQQRALAKYVVASDVSLSVTLVDGRIVTVPLDWYPRLNHGTPAERNRWRLLGRGVGIHWPDLDEDISVDGILGGRRSMVGAASFKRWLSYRARGQTVPVLEVPLPPDMEKFLEREQITRNRSKDAVSSSQRIPSRVKRLSQSA